MSTTELKALLDQVADTRELVLRRAASLGPRSTPCTTPGATRTRRPRTPTAPGAPAAAPTTTRLPRRAGPRGRRAGRARAVTRAALSRAARAARRSCASASGVSWAYGKPTRWRPVRVDEHDRGGVVELAALRLHAVALPDRRELAPRRRAGSARGPVIRRSLRKRRARAGVSFAGSTETASSGTSSARVVERAADLVDQRRARVLAGRVDERHRDRPAAVLAPSSRASPSWSRSAEVRRDGARRPHEAGPAGRADGDAAPPPSAPRDAMNDAGDRRDRAERRA